MTRVYALRLNLAIIIIFTTLCAWAARPSEKAFTSSNPHTHQINKRLKNQMKKIIEGLRTHKISQAQANTLKADLRSIRAKEVSFFKTNGNKELTVDQQNQLNSLLDKNSGVLSETQN